MLKVSQTEILEHPRGYGVNKSPPRKAKVSKDINRTFENCQVCGGVFKKGRGLRIHLSKSKAGCKRILEGRIYNKSSTGGSQEQHHSGSTSNNIPETAAFDKEAPEHQEMWSIFSLYPETISQCVGRKLKELRLEAATIALHDNVEREVKERIAEEERVQLDTLIIDNEDEQEIREEVENVIDVEKEEGILRIEDSNQFVKKQKVKSIVSRPDIRRWLDSKATRNRKDMKSTKQNPSNRSVLHKKAWSPEQQRVQMVEPQADLRKWLNSNADQRTLGKKQNRDVLAEVCEEESELTVSKQRVRSKVTKPDIREWLDGKVQSKKSMSVIEAETEKSYTDMLLTMNVGPPDEILSRHFLEMTRRDYRSLGGRNFLNDKVIDEYLQLVRLRNVSEELPKVYPFTTHAFSWLEDDYERNFPNVMRWCKEDLTEMEILLIPIHKADHWSLVVVDVRKEKLSYYDSIIGNRRRSNAPKVMKKFVEQYWKHKGKNIKLKVIIVDTAPVQRNGYDCGVFVCQNAEKISRDAIVSTRQEDMPKARETMVKDIFLGTIKRQWPLGNTVVSTVAPLKKKIGKNESMQVKKKNEPVPKKERDKMNEQRVDRKKVEPKKKEGDTKMRIKWPNSVSKEWPKLDEDLTALLKILFSPPEKLAEAHPKIIYEMSKERFGIVEPSINKEKQPAGPSKRQRRCKRLREEINQLKAAYKEAPREEKEGINELQKEKLKSLRLAKRAETLRQNRKKFSSNCKEFLGQPYQFARSLLAPKPKGDLQSTKEEVEQHLKEAHCDPDHGKEREDLEDLLQYEPSEMEFDDNPPAYKEFANKLRKTRSKSAPGPNGVPYLVYKRCPGVAKLLWSYLRLLWRRNIVSNAWRQAEGVFIPKEEGASTVNKFRTISLLNVEGKLFFSLKADRITDFLLASGYIDPSIQKGGIPGVSGCLEHTAVLSQLIREAKSEKKNLVITWLDIANAYGSIPHDVIQKALVKAHVPESTRSLIESYYSDVKIRFSTRSFTTEWQRVEKGIITGCTLSVILFALTMSWLVESAKNVTKGPMTSSGQRQPNTRLFMDDINGATETVPQSRYLLSNIDRKLKWAGLSARAKKCRSLVIIKGKVKQRLLKIGGEAITPIQELPIKHLGKQYNETLTESEQIDFTVKQATADLKRIDRCKIPGRYKAWILQHMMMPRIMWPLSIYNVPLSTVESLQSKITTALKRWLKLPKNLSNACFYSKTTKLKLPYSSLVEEFKAAKARNLVTFQESQDECIKNAGIVVDAGRKANTPAEVDEAKSRLRVHELVGVPNKGKEGLGMRKRQYYTTSSKKERRDMIVKAVREKEEESRIVKMTNFPSQGANLRWEVPQRQIKHSNIIRASDDQLKFLIKSVYDILPTPANKNRWYKTEEKCLLCGGEGTLTHILSGCKVALCQGRYKWRHDKVLRELASAVQAKVTENSSKVENRKTRIKFVKEGQKVERSLQEEENYSYLTAAKDWKVTVDVDKSLKIPAEICNTNLRPDIIIVSRVTKQIGIVELTVPNEDRIEVSGELKRLKYEQIAQEGRLNGWRVRIWAVEIGCRGFPAVSMSTFLKDIGYKGGIKKKVIEKMSKVAEEASHSLWKASHYKKWGGKE